MIQGYIIALSSQHETSRNCMKSIEKTGSQIDAIVYEATTPYTAEEHLERDFTYFDSKDYYWNWPMSPDKNVLDMKTGLHKTAYQPVADQYKVEACSISHMRLWDLCASTNQPMVIMEHDALFTDTFNAIDVSGNKIVGLNDPMGATRRGGLYHDTVSSFVGVQRTPIVNNSHEKNPQGLAGNSAYYIEPEGARILLDNIKEYGMFPNDAYMCRELFPWLKVVYPYYTKVQNISESSTTR